MILIIEDCSSQRIIYDYMLKNKQVVIAEQWLDEHNGKPWDYVLIDINSPFHNHDIRDQFLLVNPHLAGRVYLMSADEKNIDNFIYKGLNNQVVNFVNEKLMSIKSGIIK